MAISNYSALKLWTTQNSAELSESNRDQPLIIRKAPINRLWKCGLGDAMQKHTKDRNSSSAFEHLILAYVITALTELGLRIHTWRQYRENRRRDHDNMPEWSLGGAEVPRHNHSALKVWMRCAEWLNERICVFEEGIFFLIQFELSLNCNSGVKHEEPQELEKRCTASLGVSPSCKVQLTLQIYLCRLFKGH